MTELLNLELPRTLDALVARFATGHAGWRVEAWLFDNQAARRAAEARLGAAGVKARFRSAYKPLLHHVLEEAPRLGRVTVALPSHASAPAGRFRLEAFPTAALVGELVFAEGGGELTYRVAAEGHVAEVFAPNVMRADHLGEARLTPCGWLRAWDAAGAVVEDGPLETEYEAVFRHVMAAVAGHSWPAAAPYFEVLEITAELPGIERPVGWGDEVISTAEAMHEDFYFSILELMKRRSGLPAADRTLQPGQIVPDIATHEGPARVRVRLRAPGPLAELPGPSGLEEADRPLTSGQIVALTDALGGERRDIGSVQGRPLLARLVAGQGRGLLLSSGQHANETSGPVGALRAAQALRAAGRGFGFIPCENPDGYALHHALRVRNAGHMHHAARYSALGDDVEARLSAPFHEKAARLDLIAATGARLHLNLHGYPAHEWTRPLSGYLPAGFELWTIPKGFFLILRHRPGLGGKAIPFLEALTAELAEDAALGAYNAAQLATWGAHAGAVPFPVINGIPCNIVETDRQGTDWQMITEYPDETVYGEAFLLAQRTQMRAALGAVRLYDAGMLDG